MRRGSLAAIAALMSVSVLLAVAGPVSAFQVIKTTGKTADYGSQSGHADDSTRPGARCGYSYAPPGGMAYLRWIKVFHFLAVARDLTSGRDSQLVSQQVLLQRQVNGGSWKTVAKSAVQKRTAYDDQSASFTDQKVSIHATSASQHYRALLTLEWWRNGAVEGSVKVRLEFYSVKWTVGDPAYVYQDACGGASD